MRQVLWITLLSITVVVCTACTRQADNIDVNTQSYEEVVVTPQATSEPSTQPFSTQTDVGSLEQDLDTMKLETETFQ